MSARRPLLVVSSMLAFAIVACNEPTTTRTPAAPSFSSASGESSRLDDQDVSIQYGRPIRVGNGIVRTYIATQKANRDIPVEIGVAMSENAMLDLPTAPAPVPAAAGHDHGNHVGHSNMTVFLLDLPETNPTTYKFVQFDWNPLGHEPAGVYDLPHFDFHFYTVPLSVRNSILPTDPQFAQKAANYPAQEFRSPFYLDAATAAGGAPPAAVTIPQMGLHWLDVRSPELQVLAGNPSGYRPFTKTFIYGSWDGAFIFDEPMITRAYIMEKRDAADPAVRNEVIPVSYSTRRQVAGYYPSAYRIAYDEKAKEYRIALTQLEWRN